MDVSSDEGRIPFPIDGMPSGCHTWYKLVGDITSAPPLIMIHGGPGAGHSDLLGLGAPLRDAGIPTIFYDQIGCGNSSLVREKAQDAGFWSIDLFCAEIDNLVDHFGLRERGFSVHGHSWGGMLAGTYAARRPRGLHRLIIAHAPASAQVFASEALRLLKALPASDAILAMEENKDFDTPDYQAACLAFNKRHFCLLEPWPQVMSESERCFDECTMMKLLWGPSRFRMLGNLKDFDATKTAHKIEVPTLLLTGRFDYITETTMKPWHDTIPNVQWTKMEWASHMAHLEQPDTYRSHLERFLLS